MSKINNSSIAQRYFWIAFALVIVFIMIIGKETILDRGGKQTQERQYYRQAQPRKYPQLRRTTHGKFYSRIQNLYGLRYR